MVRVSSFSLGFGLFAGVSRCARKKPTHPGFVKCVTKFCRRSLEGGRFQAKDLTEQNCLDIRERAAASDIRMAASVALRQETSLEIPRRLRVIINKCGDLAEAEGSHAKFVRCMSNTLEMALFFNWISTKEASVLEEAGRTLSIGTFGQPTESSNNEGKLRHISAFVQSFEFPQVA